MYFEVAVFWCFALCLLTILFSIFWILYWSDCIVKSCILRSLCSESSEIIFYLIDSPLLLVDQPRKRNYTKSTSNISKKVLHWEPHITNIEHIHTHTKKGIALGTAHNQHWTCLHTKLYAGIYTKSTSDISKKVLHWELHITHTEHIHTKLYTEIYTKSTSDISKKVLHWKLNITNTKHIHTQNCRLGFTQNQHQTYQKRYCTVNCAWSTSNLPQKILHWKLLRINFKRIHTQKCTLGTTQN